MKRTRKIVSTLLTVLLACSLLVTPAFAADGDDSNTAGGGTTAGEGAAAADDTGIITDASGISQLPVTKYLQVPVKSTIPDVNFYFSMTAVTVDAGTKDSADNTVYTGVFSGDAIAIYAKAAMTSNSTREAAAAGSTDQNAVSTANFELSQLPLSSMKVGYVYRYQIQEILPSNAPDTINTTEDVTASNITYDTSKTYTVDIYIGEKTDGSHIVNRIIVKNGQNRKSELTFKNILQTSNLVIEKVLDGDYTNPDDEFTFQIKIPVGGVALDLKDGTDMQAYKITKNADGSTTETKLTEDKAILVAGEQTDDEGWQTFTLKGGEQLVIYGVPTGMIYFVKETNSLGYTTTHAHITESETLNANTSYSDANPTDYYTIVSGNNIVAFKNTKNQPNTGIRMDIIPYVVAIFGVAIVAGSLVYVSRKKKDIR